MDEATNETPGSPDTLKCDPISATIAGKCSALTVSAERSSRLALKDHFPHLPFPRNGTPERPVIR